MSYASEITADSPVAWWRMGESSGQPQDSSGNGNHTTVTTGSPTYSASGATADGNTAISLPGTAGNKFTAPHHSTLNVADVFTLEAWIKRLRSGSLELIVDKGANGYQMDLATTGAIRLVKSGVALVVTSSTAISDTTTWHHVVCTKNGSTVKQYLDSVDVTGTVTNSTFINTGDLLYIGLSSGGSFPVNAVLDEIAIYGTALSAARVLAHYTAASGAASTFVPRVIAVT